MGGVNTKIQISIIQTRKKENTYFARPSSWACDGRAPRRTVLLLLVKVAKAVAYRAFIILVLAAGDAIDSTIFVKQVIDTKCHCIRFWGEADTSFCVDLFISVVCGRGGGDAAPTPLLLSIMRCWMDTLMM